jgi:hypothetical protein
VAVVLRERPLGHHVIAALDVLFVFSAEDVEGGS